MKKLLLPLLTSAVCLGLASLAPAQTAPAHDADGWISLFDGKSLDGWKSNESSTTFRVEDGLIIVHGPRSHLFYVGPVAHHDFKNFELSLEVLTKPHANSGVYFHTQWQDNDWPHKGYEIQVNNSHENPKRTGGIYDIVDNYAAFPDDEWFTLLIRVEGQHITASVNGKLVSEFTEPADWVPPKGYEGRSLSHGTFALQAHDPDSEVHYRNIRVRLLP